MLIVMMMKLLVVMLLLLLLLEGESAVCDDQCGLQGMLFQRAELSGVSGQAAIRVLAQGVVLLSNLPNGLCELQVRLDERRFVPRNDRLPLEWRRM